MMEKQQKNPEGELALQTIAMPANTNAHGDIFGGWLVSQMDLAASVVAKKRAKGRVVTVAIDKMVFIRPVYVGDLVTCYSRLVKFGRTSMTINVEAWRTNPFTETKDIVTDGVFTFVAVDEEGKSRSLP